MQTNGRCRVSTTALRHLDMQCRNRNIHPADADCRAAIRTRACYFSHSGGGALTALWCAQCTKAVRWLHHDAAVLWPAVGGLPDILDGCVRACMCLCVSVCRVHCVCVCVCVNSGNIIRS